MRILIVGGNPNEVCGSAIAVKHIIRSLAKTNEVYMLPNLPVFQKKSFDPNDNFVIVEKRLSIDILKYCIKNSISWLRIVLPYLKFSPRGLVYYFITLFNLATFEKAIEKTHPDIVHVHGIAIDALPIIECCLGKKVPLGVTLHGLYSLNPSISLYFNKRLEKDIITKLIENDILITAVSSSVKELCVNNFHIPPDKIKVVLNGVDYEKFGCVKRSKSELRKQHSLPQDKIVLLQVGTLNKRKNHIAVLRAITSMDEKNKEKIIYLVVGEGGEKSNLSNFVKENGLSKNVVFAGRVSDEKLVDMYCLSDFFILPSTSEGLPLVFLEAMAAGLPIITFKDLEGVKDIYQPYCMELVPNRSTESIIKSITHAIERSWDKQQIMRYIENWDWDSFCDEYKNCYKEVISSRGSDEES